MKNITLYKTLDSLAFANIFNCSQKYSFYQNGDLEELNITESNGNMLCLESEDGSWDSINNGLVMEIKVDIKPDDKLKEICMDDSKLALCLLVYSNESKFKKYYKVVDLIDTCHQTTKDMHISISKGKITGTLSFEYQLCLVEPSNKDIPFGINNTQGAILGKSDDIDIILSGNGSLFPIVNVSAPKQPLWRFIFDCDEPETDLFLDKVKIELNTSHKDFKLIDVTKKDTYCDRVFLEIMQNSIFQFLCILKTNDRLNDLNQNFMNGTVMQVAKYLVQVHDIKVDSVESICTSLNNFFNDNGGEI